MVRGSSDFTAAVDTLFCLRGNGDGRFILETAKARRGRPPEPVRVRIEDEDGVGKDPKDGTFSRALKLGYQRGQPAKLPREKPNEPQHYALAPEWRDDP